MFDMDPQPDKGDPIISLVRELKDHLINARASMRAIDNWGGDDIRQWHSLLTIVKENYEPTYTITPRRTFLEWVGHKVSYLYKDNIWADYSFWGRAIVKSEELVPQAFARDEEMADMFRKRVGVTIERRTISKEKEAKL